MTRRPLALVVWVTLSALAAGAIADEVEVRVNVQVEAAADAEPAAAEAPAADAAATAAQEKERAEREARRQRQREQQQKQREQMIDQQAVHWQGQVTGVLNAELQLIRATVGDGDLPPAARRAVTKAGEAAVKTIAREIAARQMGQSKQTDDVMAPLSVALGAALAEQAGPEQAAGYQRAVEERARRRRAALIAQLVVAIDAEVYLTAKQREELIAALDAQWKDEMAMGLAWSNTDGQGRRGFMGLPAEVLRPVLTQAQRGRIGNAPNVPAGNLIHIQLNRFFGNGWSLERDGWWYP